VFENLTDAEYGLAALHRTGLRDEDVSVLLRDAPAGDVTGVGGDTGTNVASGAAAGATVGGVVGGLASGLLALLVPGIGPLLGTGVLANLLTGLAVGAAGGGILGALLGLGVPADEAATYQEHIQAGRVLLTIHADSPDQARQMMAALDATNAYDVRLYGGGGAAPVAPSMARLDEAAGSPPAAENRALAAPPPPEQGPPLTTGDVAAVAEGGPDVRGESGVPVLANRGLTDADSDLSAWRSGGEESRPEPPGERGLGTDRGAEPQSEAATGGGDVAAVNEGGPDVRPPGVDSGDRDLGSAGAEGADWADTPTDWRSGGEAARAETGEGVGAAPATDRDLAPAPAANLEATPPTDAYYTNPRLLSRSALRAAVPSDPPAPDRGLTAGPNPEGYGDGGTE
jgi:hypothetical protein